MPGTVLRARATEQEYEAWAACAERAGLPLSTWIRRACRHAAEVENSIARQSEFDRRAEEATENARLRRQQEIREASTIR
jgi:hypothetical protein